MSAEGSESGDVRLSELVRVYDHALPQSLCERVIGLFEQDRERQFRRQRQNTWIEYTVTRSPLSEWRDVERALMRNMIEHLKDYAQLPAAQPLALKAPRAFEQIMLKKYEPGRPAPDGFPEHCDAYDVATSVRQLGFLWYLNDVADGGETDFPVLGKRIEPRTGRLVLLPPAWMFVHAGRPPVSEPKYIATSYLSFRDPEDDLRFAYPLR
jgi:prolyl 4-hydroxylase